MTTTPEAVFHYEIDAKDEPTGPVTTIVCHGRIVNQAGDQLKEIVKPLISKKGGHIILDLTDVNYMDNSGLGTLVGLKVSAMKEGYCKLELVNLSARVKELLRLSNLTQLFSS
jgi:anti-sigma B factor antagonist